ncbi:uncharacterized protein LOC136030664 [Artemia franciscana]|uniref:uncharacterized protein LOC136030664 n=1 Tax=Artemia franciscana TaxID=6661 RepID=UPI0032DB6B1A
MASSIYVCPVLTFLKRSIAKDKDTVVERNFVKKLGCADKVKHTVSRRNGLVVHVVDENSAVAAIPNNLKIRAKIIRTEYASIIKVDTDFSVFQMPVLVENVISATRFGNSRVVQLKFKTNDDLDHSVKFGMKIQYCLFCVTRPIKKPQQCLNCQGFGHFSRECSNPTKYSRCAGDHSNKDHACQTDIKCVTVEKPTEVTNWCV